MTFLEMFFAASCGMAVGFVLGGAFREGKKCDDWQAWTLIRIECIAALNGLEDMRSSFLKIKEIAESKMEIYK